MQRRRKLCAFHKYEGHVAQPQFKGDHHSAGPDCSSLAEIGPNWVEISPMLVDVVAMSMIQSETNCGRVVPMLVKFGTTSAELKRCPLKFGRFGPVSTRFGRFLPELARFGRFLHGSPDEESLCCR